jgi:hypothetical protein|tara:strand:- start:1813 stop:2514 length:702 start_codon:yes stop_codon:yes gene_type:complete
MQPYKFSFSYYKDILKVAAQNNYSMINCYNYFKNLEKLPKHYIILRHDIEHYPERALEFAKIEAERGVSATYFVRVHSKDYNIYNFKDYNYLKEIMSLGHEIGLHTEAIDFSKTSNEEPERIFRKEIDLLELVLDCKVYGVASHGDWTGYNNLDFFLDHKIEDYGLLYQAYQENFFDANIYITDGQHTYWKAYENGQLLDSQYGPDYYIKKCIPNLYLLTHDKNWYHTEYHLM